MLWRVLHRLAAAALRTATLNGWTLPWRLPNGMDGAAGLNQKAIDPGSYTPKIMAEMEMPLPDNIVPMMTGQGLFGSVEMGGMFSVVKVRKGQKPGDYKDPGWCKPPPPGGVAFEYKGPLAEPARFQSEGGKSMPHAQKSAPEIEVQVRKPAAKSGHSGH